MKYIFLLIPFLLGGCDLIENLDHKFKVFLGEEKKEIEAECIDSTGKKIFQTSYFTEYGYIITTVNSYDRDGDIYVFYSDGKKHEINGKCTVTINYIPITKKK